MSKLTFSSLVCGIAQEYAEKHNLTLPLSPEQLLNAVADYCERKVGNKIYFGESVIGVNYNEGDVRIDREYNVYQYDGEEWQLQGNIKGEKGDTGAQGNPGATGADGKAATISVGSVTSLDPGSEPTVVNAGTENAAVFNFGIPKGEKGDTGAQGNPGSAGADGKAATINVGTVTSLEPGSQPTVVNAGTENAAVFNFGIPKGEKGDKGNKGDPAYIYNHSIVANFKEGNKMGTVRFVIASNIKESVIGTGNESDLKKTLEYFGFDCSTSIFISASGYTIKSLVVDQLITAIGLNIIGDYVSPSIEYVSTGADATNPVGGYGSLEISNFLVSEDYVGSN